MGKIRDKIAEKRASGKGFDEIHAALLGAVKDILEPIKRNYTLEIEITCKIAGVGSVATFEHQKKDISSYESSDEKGAKIVEFLKNKFSKAKDRINEVLESKNLMKLELSAGTESIPAISWLTDINFKITINLQ